MCCSIDRKIWSNESSFPKVECCVVCYKSRCIMHAFINVSGLRKWETTNDVLQNQVESESESEFIHFLLCSVKQKEFVRFFVLWIPRENICFSPFFLHKISFTFYLCVNAYSFLRLYIYFHVFTFFLLVLILFICPFCLRVNKQPTRGPFHFIYVKDKFFCAYFVSCWFALSQKWSIRRYKCTPTEFSCPFVWICESCLQSERTTKRMSILYVCVQHTQYIDTLECACFLLEFPKNSFASGDDAESCRTDYIYCVPL